MSRTVLCQKCLVPGESDTYKGDDVLRCQGCDRILYRGVNP